ncbi:MAG: polysaccharide biosynthesis tyrosine autokinase [Candidatus Binatia bacterium]
MPGDRSGDELVAPAAAATAAAGRAASVPPVPPVYDYVEAEFSEVRRRQARDYLRIVYKYRWLAAALFVVTLGLTVLVTLLTPRLYTAATRLQLQREGPIQLQLEDNVVNLDGTDRNVNGASSFLSTQVAALKSRDLAERVIRTHDLASNETFLHPTEARSGLLSVGGRLLSFLRPRGFRGGGVVDQAADDESAGGADVPTELLDRYMRYLDVRDVRGTDLVEVRFTTPSPELSAMLAGAHTQAYMEANAEARLANDVTAKEFLGKQLEEARGRVEQAEGALKAFATDHPNVAVNQEQKLTGQQMNELTTQISSAEADRIGLQTEYETVVKRDDPMSHFLDKPGIEKLYLSVLDLRAQRAALDPKLGPNHPEMIQLREQENEIARQLKNEIAQQTAGVKARLDAARAREKGLRTKLAYLEESAILLRDLGARYELLKNDVESAGNLYRTLVKQAMETAVNAQLAASNVRVIERAEIPEHPSRPNVPLNLAFGLVLALGVSVVATIVCDAFDNTVKSSTDVENQLQLPMLGTVPNFALARRSSARRASLGVEGSAVPAAVAAAAAATPGPSPRAVVVLQEPTSVISEAFRALRTAVLFSTPAAPPKVILLTSATSGEGKSVTSLNLAATLAESGSRVLLIDADLRRPTCHRSLGTGNSRGLSSFLSGQATLADVIVPLDKPHLDFLPAGPTPPNPAELVGSARMRDALAGLRDEYEFVIVDSPPVVPVTDGVVLSREADAVVLVVKGHDTPLELVRRARDHLGVANAHLIGAVINNVDLGWGDLYFYSRYTGYYGQAEAA